MDNPYDGSAAMVVPQNIEKVPLFHWRPGSRVLSVGSRDGASFAGILPDDEQRTFRRRLSFELIAGAAHKVGIDTWSASWTASLRYPQGLQQLFDSGLPSSVVITSGHGEQSCLDACLGFGVDAWSLLIDLASPLPPLAPQIIAEGKHVEVCLGLSDERDQAVLGDVDWSRVGAVHLMPLRSTMAVGQVLQQWAEEAKAALPDDLIIYSSQQQYTLCQYCGEELIWRSSGRSRQGQIDESSNTCRNCGAVSPIFWTN